MPSDLRVSHPPPAISAFLWSRSCGGRFCLVPASSSLPQLRRPPPTIHAGQIFWITPNTPLSAVCHAIVIRSGQPDAPSAVPFCHAFRQCQVIEFRDPWARIGSDVWIRIVDLTNPNRLQPFNPRSPWLPNLLTSADAESKR